MILRTSYIFLLIQIIHSKIFYTFAKLSPSSFQSKLIIDQLSFQDNGPIVNLNLVSTCQCSQEGQTCWPHLLQLIDMDMDSHANVNVNERECIASGLNENMMIAQSHCASTLHLACPSNTSGIPTGTFIDKSVCDNIHSVDEIITVPVTILLDDVKTWCCEKCPIRQNKWEQIITGTDTVPAIWSRFALSYGQSILQWFQVLTWIEVPFLEKYDIKGGSGITIDRLQIGAIIMSPERDFLKNHSSSTSSTFSSTSSASSEFQLTLHSCKRSIADVIDEINEGGASADIGKNIKNVNLNGLELIIGWSGLGIQQTDVAHSTNISSNIDLDPDPNSYSLSSILLGGKFEKIVNFTHYLSSSLPPSSSAAALATCQGSNVCLVSTCLSPDEWASEIGTNDAFSIELVFTHQLSIQTAYSHVYFQMAIVTENMPWLKYDTTPSIVLLSMSVVLISLIIIYERGQVYFRKSRRLKHTRLAQDDPDVAAATIGNKHNVSTTSVEINDDNDNDDVDDQDDDKNSGHIKMKIMDQKQLKEISRIREIVMQMDVSARIELNREI